MIDDRTRGWALAAVGMLLVSTDSYFIRRADFDVWTIAFLFGLTSAASLGAVYAVTTTERPLVAIRRDRWPLLIVAGLASSSQIAFTAAVNNTAVSNVVVIVGATPIFASVFAWLVLRERTDRRVVLAIGITMIGIVIVVSGSIGTPTIDGDLFALVAILAFSASVVVWRRHPGVDRPLALALSSLVMATVAAPFASVGVAPLRVFVAVGLMGLLFNPLGRVAYTSAPRYAPASEVALFAPVETVAATVWAWVFFSERPAVTTFAGGAIVIGGVVYGTVGRRRTPLPPLA